MIGEKFGKWTVIDEAPSKHGHKYWLCQCECGTIKAINGSCLRRGGSKSCGCSRREKTNLIGQKFNRWTIIGDAPFKNNHSYWLCQCECGTIKEVKEANLKNGDSKSCGCLKNEKLSERSLKIIPKGTKFGKLTVLELLDERQYDHKTVYKCECECGNIINVLRDNLIGSHVMSCGCSKISKGELIIEQLLLQKNIPFEKQKTFENCRFLDTNHLAYFDFYVDNKYIIEYDGIQHFKITGGWGTEEHFKKLQEHDNLKNKYCFDYNIPIIRIPYWHLDNICLNDLLLETSEFLLKERGD